MQYEFDMISNALLNLDLEDSIEIDSDIDFLPKPKLKRQNAIVRETEIIEKLI